MTTLQTVLKDADRIAEELLPEPAKVAAAVAVLIQQVGRLAGGELKPLTDELLGLSSAEETAAPPAPAAPPVPVVSAAAAAPVAPVAPAAPVVPAAPAAAPPETNAQKIADLQAEVAKLTALVTPAS